MHCARYVKLSCLHTPNAYLSTGDETDDVLLGNLHRLGSETVLRRYNEKRRTLSAASSDYDPTYSNLNETRAGGPMSISITRTGNSKLHNNTFAPA